MSLASALNAAVTGLTVNRHGMEIASHNIGNANTEGYSRRIQHRETIDVQGAGVRGVRVSDVERATDRFLTEQVRSQSAAFGRSDVRDRYLGDMQDLFGSLTSDSSVGQRLADMMSSLEELGVQPESPTAAAGVIQEASAFARDLNAMSSDILALRNKADVEIANAIQELNADLALVADLNDKIATVSMPGTETSDPGDLMDQRDLALKRIGGKINIKTFERPSGEIVVFTGDARTLIDGDAAILTYTPSGGALATVYQDIALQDGVSIQTDIRDGGLKGLLEARDRLLPDLHRQLDRLAAETRDAVNAVHNRGMGLPAAPALTGSRVFANPATDQTTVGSDVRFVVADRNGLTVATFDLPAGVYSIDSLATAIDAGLGADGAAAVVDGRLVVDAANPAHGLGMVDLNGGVDAPISFDDGAGPQAFSGFSGFFGLNDVFATAGVGPGEDGAAGAIAVRADLVSNPERLARGRLATGTAPVPGTDRAIAIGDGSNMQAIAAELAADRNFAAVGGLPPIDKPLHEYASEVLGRQSQLKADAGERRTFDEALVEQFEGRLGDIAGVSIDEELANILVLQNAFNASARIIATVDEMMDVITNLKR